MVYKALLSEICFVHMIKTVDNIKLFLVYRRHNETNIKVKIKISQPTTSSNHNYIWLKVTKTIILRESLNFIHIIQVTWMMET